MKITEKLYIERLEKMMNRHRGDPCPYCPMIKYYNPEIETFINGEGVDGYDNESCKICMKLTKRYANVKCDTSISQGWCPCNYYRNYYTGNFGTEACDMPKDYMVKVAWKVIRGWKKDNKEK